MLVTYIQKPNGLWDEVTDFKNSLKTKDLTHAKVILDFREKKVVKNGLNPEAGYDDMLEFYKRTIGDQLTPYLP
jgi:hypothetical protein